MRRSLPFLLMRHRPAMRLDAAGERWLPAVTGRGAPRRIDPAANSAILLNPSPATPARAGPAVLGRADGFFPSGLHPSDFSSSVAFSSTIDVDGRATAVWRATTELPIISVPLNPNLAPVPSGSGGLYVATVACRLGPAVDGRARLRRDRVAPSALCDRADPIAL